MRNEMETKLIDFEGGELLGVKSEDGIVYMGIKKTCLDIGMTERQSKYQIQKIQENELLNEGVQNFVLVQMEGKREVKREVLGIEESFINAWLFKIELTPSFKKENPNAHEKLLAYQKKASKVLHNAFMATEEQKQAFYNEMGIKGEIVELKGKVDNMTLELINTKDKLNTLIDSSTINSRQAQKLLHSAKDRVSTMLGGTHTPTYRKESRMYFKNLWLDFGKQFEIASYKDINPLNFNDGFTFISNWSMS